MLLVLSHKFYFVIDLEARHVRCMAPRIPTSSIASVPILSLPTARAAKNHPSDHRVTKPQREDIPIKVAHSIAFARSSLKSFDCSCFKTLNSRGIRVP